MTQDEIIDMARQVSNTPIDATSTPDLFGVNQIVKFAKLIAQHEREACAKEAEHWQKIGQNPAHKCGEYIASAIRGRGQA